MGHCAASDVVTLGIMVMVMMVNIMLVIITTTSTPQPPFFAEFPHIGMKQGIYWQTQLCRFNFELLFPFLFFYQRGWLA